MMIYLYLKTHRFTGLSYLGKTTRDPYKYKGSGLRWRRHLAKHGDDVFTVVLFESDDKNKLKEQGEYYSNLWNVVANPGFANLKPESGDGGDMSMCDSWQRAIRKRDTSGSRNSMYGRSAIVEQNIRWYNNGIDNLYIPEGTQPEGYKLGRIIAFKKPHSKETKQLLSTYGRKPCVSPKGEIFDSRGAAAKAYGITSAAIGGLIRRKVSGWRWL